MLKEKKAVIFDLDGTLVDSMWMWEQIDIEFLEQNGCVLPPDLHRQIEGMSFSETARYFKERFSLLQSVEEIKETWVSMSLYKYQHQVPLKEGARDFLNYLKASGIKAGIATSNKRVLVDAVLKSLDITSCFQAVATACEVLAGKPAPDIYLKVANILSVEPAGCLVFEDIPAGILAGKRAGMTVCAVEDPFSEDLKDEKISLSDYYIRDYFEVLNRMKQDEAIKKHTI